MSLSIIGSAGRLGTHLKITPQLYEKMCTFVLEKIKESGSDTFFSGGSSFCDHIAITLFLRGDIDNLTLYLPANFTDKFDSSYEGSQLNKYHQQFSERVGFNSLEQLKEAIARGVKTRVFNNFYTRNAEVAKSKVIIAFGWEESPSGGTQNTIKSARGTVHYFNINSFI